MITHTLTLVFREFKEINDSEDDANWQKYLGSGAKTKLRAMSDLLKAVTEHVDAQTDVEEFNVLITDIKRLHAIVMVGSSWHKIGGGATDAFVTTFLEVRVFIVRKHSL